MRKTPPETWGDAPWGAVRTQCEECGSIIDFSAMSFHIRCEACGNKFECVTWVDVGGDVHHKVGTPEWFARFGKEPKFEIGDIVQVRIPNGIRNGMSFRQEDGRVISINGSVDRSAARYYNEMSNGPFPEDWLVLVKKGEEYQPARKVLHRQLPTTKAFVAAVTKRICLAAGDSDALAYIKAINETLKEWKRRPYKNHQGG